MTILETERLTLRKLTTEDAAFVLEMLNDPAFIRNVADRGVRTIADATAYIEQKHLPQYAQFGFGFYLMELKGGFLPIGMCGLMKRETRDDVDIGYSVLERFAGRGYAFEAASAVLHYGREVLRIPRIVGLTAPDNAVSIRLLEKLGLRYAGMVDLPGYDGPSKLFA